MNSAQTLALYSPDYIKDTAVYSRAEHYASWWQEPGGDARKLIPIVLRETPITPLIAMISRIEVKGTTPDEAAAQVVKRLKTPKEIESRDHARAGLPLPQTFNAAYRPNPNFTGRFEAMESLQKALRGGNAAVTAVAGMGGVGKTTLAAEYCHRFGGRYGGVWWVRAEQESVMLADLQTLGQRLGVVEGKNTETDARATLDHLASLTEPWLLVYDNAPNPDAVAKWLPTGAVRCLITSRFTAFDSIAPVTRLDQWSDEVTAGYLLTRTGRNDTAGAARLAKSLGGLPLAAEQAVVFLGPSPEISFDDYAADITRLINEERPAGAKGQYEDTVYAAFVKSLGAISETNKGSAALDLIRLCAFLSPDGVELDLLTQAAEVKMLPDSLAAAMGEKFAKRNVLAALTSLSLLRQESGPFGPVLIFHRLLLDVARDWMGEDNRALWGGAAVQLMARTLPGTPDKDPRNDPSLWSLYARLMPHVAALDAHAPRTGLAARALARLFNLGTLYLTARGDREGALALAERCVALLRVTRAEPLQLANGLGVLGNRYFDVGRLDDAEAAAREVLEVKESRLNRNDPSIAIALSNLACVYLKRENFAAAEPLFLRAADIEKAAHGTETATYGKRLGHLDNLYDGWAEHSGDVGKRRSAARYSTQALSVTRASRHPETSMRHFNLAVLKARLGERRAAVEEAERALAIMLSLDLAQHPDTQHIASGLVILWESDKAARLRSGDIHDLLPVIAQIEAEHRAWVAAHPENRHFGPPSPFADQRP